MNIPHIIEQKRDGARHSREQLEYLVLGYVAGKVPDYQVAAWLMAVYWRGMDGPETTMLTEIMAASGDQLDLSSLSRTVDKHSTGGVGDKTSLVLGPMLAACGLTVAKMSGRGLAHTGGTIDKLESIPGWRSELSDEQFLRQAKEIGLVLVGQSKNLAPADGLFYALRDVTATVPSIPLIASSIMSKKLAAGAKTIVLDVKVGAGAFMNTLALGRELARRMVEIGEGAGRRVRAILTDMDAPLGCMAGNALEVREALATLRGEGPDDLRDLCLVLAEEALLAEGVTLAEAQALPRQVLASGQALEKFRAFVAAQGGDPRCADDPTVLEVAGEQLIARAAQDGLLERLDALSVGRAVLALGGGRTRKGEAIDFGVGVELHAKPGQVLRAGQPVATLYHRAGRGLEQAQALMTSGVVIGPGETAQPAPPLVLERLELAATPNSGGGA
jgi:pyrimidine-nucleoside phosphorylase